MTVPGVGNEPVSGIPLTKAMSDGWFLSGIPDSISQGPLSNQQVGS